MVDWNAWEELGLWVDALGGLLFIVLGLMVLFAKLRTRSQAWFVAFALSFGAFYLLNNLRVIVGGFATWVDWTEYGLRILTMVCSVGLGVSLVSMDTVRKAWPATVAALVIFIIYAAAPILSFVTTDLKTDTFVSELTYGFSYAGLIWMVLVQAFGPPSARSGSIAFAMVPFIATNSGLRMVLISIHRKTILVEDAGPAITDWILSLYAVAFFLMTAVVIAVWGWHMVTKSPTDPWPRRIVVQGAAFLLLGVTWSAVTSAGAPNNLGILGTTRAFGVVALAYSILRHQFLELDLKLKFGLRQSTVAAIFIAAFFVVSELVAGLLSERIGLIAGVMTTGVLVFAIAPLQRLGEKVASTALPDAKPVEERSLRERKKIYQEMLDSAWSDGHLSRTELKMLDVARSRLNLTLYQANQLEKKFHQTE